MFNSEWVFPSQVRPRNPMSDGTVNKAIKRLGYGKDMVAHGFRALRAQRFVKSYAMIVRL